MDYFLKEKARKLEAKKEDFQGVAYSGAILNVYGQAMIFDLSSVSYKEKVPLLFEHANEEPLGMVSLSVENGKLLCSGSYFKSSAKAKACKELFDEGMDYQMSMRIYSENIETLKEEEVINGVTCSAGVQVGRNGVIREVSVCALGVDGDTEAILLSDKNNKVKSLEGNKMEEKLDILIDAVNKLAESIASMSKEDKSEDVKPEAKMSDIKEVIAEGAEIVAEVAKEVGEVAEKIADALSPKEQEEKIEEAVKLSVAKALKQAMPELFKEQATEKKLSLQDEAISLGLPVSALIGKRISQTNI
jgi:hypothetical protein